MIATQFTCPLCGGHYWGTSFIRHTRTGKVRVVKNVDEAYGHCNGFTEVTGPVGIGYQRCDFVWNRSEDEWVFTPVDTNDYKHSSTYSTEEKK